jgi:hypothetical protein
MKKSRELQLTWRHRVLSRQSGLPLGKFQAVLSLVPGKRALAITLALLPESLTQKLLALAMVA